MSQAGNHEKPILTVDLVIATLDDGLKFVAQKRSAQPFPEMLALPGGYVHCDVDRSSDETARRIMASKCGLAPFYMEQLATFSGATRDPRGWSATIAYLVILPIDVLRPLIEESDLELISAEALPELAFDHADILAYAIERIRAKASYSMIPASFLGETFTLPQYQAVLQELIKKPLYEASFRRKILALGVLEEAGVDRTTRRPAKLYRVAGDNMTFDHSFLQHWGS